MPRALKNLDITLGLAVIPVHLFTATSRQGVAFHLLHAKCGSRIQMRLQCPIHGIVPREETVRGYEINKDEYVRFEPEELKALEQPSSSALVIDSFVPEGTIDPVYFGDTYYLGAGKNGGRGYQVLAKALEKTKRVGWAPSRGAARRPRSRSVCTRMDSFSSDCISRTRSTMQQRSSPAPSRRSATRSGRLPSGWSASCLRQSSIRRTTRTSTGSSS